MLTFMVLLLDHHLAVFQLLQLHRTSSTTDGNRLLVLLELPTTMTLWIIRMGHLKRAMESWALTVHLQKHRSAIHRGAILLASLSKLLSKMYRATLTVHRYLTRKPKISSRLFTNPPIPMGYLHHRCLNLNHSTTTRGLPRAFQLIKTNINILTPMITIIYLAVPIYWAGSLTTRLTANWKHLILKFRPRPALWLVACMDSLMAKMPAQLSEDSAPPRSPVLPEIPSTTTSVQLSRYLMTLTELLPIQSANNRIHMVFLPLAMISLSNNCLSPDHRRVTPVH